MKHFINIVSAAILCLLLAGCSKECPEVNRIQYLKLDNTSINADKAGGEYSINVTSNTACKVMTGNIDWILVNDQEFVGNRNLVITVQDNKGSSRSGVIIISTQDESITCELTITQNG
ncbi:MAG: BACON domain-containing protein [Bacteroidales bacterium]|nr:BACON domain-containing protein [Bacteroidales bacterium]